MDVGAGKVDDHKGRRDLERHVGGHQGVVMKSGSVKQKKICDRKLGFVPLDQLNSPVENVGQAGQGNVFESVGRVMESYAEAVDGILHFAFDPPIKAGRRVKDPRRRVLGRNLRVKRARGVNVDQGKCYIS